VVIKDKTNDPPMIRCQKGVRRQERLDRVTHHLQEKLERIANRPVIVHDGDLLGLRVGHYELMSRNDCQL
jgi:hypothetical protein